MAEKKKGIKLPHVYILLIMVMLFVVVLSWIVPSGEFAQITDPATGRTTIDPNNFKFIPKTNPITFMDFFTAMHIGIAQSADIIVMLLLAVGSIYLVEKSGAIGAGIHALLEISEGKEILVISVLNLVFAILGTIGFGEGGLPFIPLTISVVMALGYDRITGIATALVGLTVGFTAGVLNFYTTGISQSLVGLPLYSGIGFRTVSLVIFYIIGVVYIVNYAKKIKKDPSKSIVAHEYVKQLEESQEEVKTEKIEFTMGRKLALIGMVIVFIIQAYGAIKLKWGLPEISALYLIYAFVLVIILKLNPSQSCIDFAVGAARLLPAALAIGLARSVMVLMVQAKIIDTAIYYLSQALEGKGVIPIMLIVYIAVIIFNFFVVSASGKAVMLMPILGPLAQLTKINQQVMILLFEFGNGFTNNLWPTSGALMAGLAMCHVEWGDWVKFAAKLFAILQIVAFGLVILAHYMNYGPF